MFPRLWGAVDMAVSLKKPEKVDLSKPECPPKMREYTPVHILDEEETIVKRPRQPPVQPQHSNDFEYLLEKNGIEVTDDGDVRNKREDEIKAHYRSLFIRSVLALVMFGVVLLIVFLVGRSSPRVGSSIESTPEQAVTSVTASENASANEALTVTRVFEDVGEVFSFFCSFIFENPLALLMILSSGVILLIKLVRQVLNMVRYR